ncbi:MAG: CrcB family protein [Euryarchaeota archaeon]|nr:CrcB family protein [Euryarchaeota archaeon]
MIGALLVGVGGAIGAVLRYLVGLSLSALDTRFPFDTLSVNVIGSFVLGWVTFVGAGEGVFLTIGIGACGAFTTFSSFSVDTVRLIEEDKPFLAGGYALSNIVLSVGSIGLAALIATS